MSGHRAGPKSADEELLDGVRRRDLASLRLLVERHGGAVVASARITVRRLDDTTTTAEDLAVAAFGSLWRDPPAPPGRPVLGELLRRVGRAARSTSTEAATAGV